MDVKEVWRERALEDWMHREQCDLGDSVARSFKHHLEFLSVGELQEVFWMVHLTDEFRYGWHDLDRIYETRSRREGFPPYCKTG